MSEANSPLARLFSLPCNSWIIVDRDFETFNKATADAINTARYEVLTALSWLQRFNASIKESNNGTS